MNPLDIKPDNPTVQQCCICYGGNSFPGPMKEALLCHLEILKRYYPILAAAEELADAAVAVYWVLASGQLHNWDGLVPLKAALRKAGRLK